MNRKLTNIVTAFGTTIVLSFSGGSALAGGLLSLDFQDAEWINPTVIDNPYWPLSPGGGVSTLIYIGETEDGCVFNKILFPIISIHHFILDMSRYYQLCRVRIVFIKTLLMIDSIRCTSP